ncbi:MAG: peptidoglycan-binding protein [Oscillospiraceae bacterium]|nr:peptidoglycan-binding protein [Oscillospiraceae bacterium]
MRTLRTGSTGPAVQLLQLALDRAGYGPLDTDGAFGPATRGAVARFQAVERLSVDGIVGPATHRALLPWYTGYLSLKIRRGDTLWSLARLYGSSVEAIRLANPGVEPENLQIGASLIVPLPFDVVPVTIDWCAALVGYCVQGLAARYPFLTAGSVGKSVLGKPLWSLRIGQGESRVLYNAEHHANEWITTPLLLRFAEELAKAFVAGEEIVTVSAGEILDHATICLIPAVDPDGMDLVTGELSGGEAFRNAQTIARAYPRFPFPSGWKANIRGVDLNLQYPAGWEQARANKYAAGIVSPAPADFVGQAPLTAPESRAMAELTERFDPALALALHSQGEVIYWKYQDLEPEGARQIATLFAEVSGYRAEEVPFASGFAGYKDWYIQTFDRPGFTVEVGRGVSPLPVGDFPEIWQRVLPILVLGALVV